MKINRYAMVELFCLASPLALLLVLMCGSTLRDEGLAASLVAGGKLLLGPIASSIWLKGTVYASPAVYVQMGIFSALAILAAILPLRRNLATFLCRCAIYLILAVHWAALGFMAAGGAAHD